MDDALKESVDNLFSDMYTMFDENRSIAAVLHQAIIEGTGLMIPGNYDFDDDNDNSDEEPKHMTEIQKQKKEIELEIADEIVEKATIKSVVLLMHSDGWFEEEDVEEDDED